MKFLISARSPLPIRIKALFRCAIFKTGRNWKLFEYSEPEDVGFWKGWYEWRGSVFAFEDTQGDLLFRW